MHLINKDKLGRIVSFIMLLAISIGSQRDAWAVGQQDQGEEIRVVQYGYTLKNSTGKLLEKAEFLTYAPVKKTSRQSCRNLIVSHPYQLLEDKLGNQILKFTFTNLPPFAAKIITIKAELVLAGVGKPAEKKKDHLAIDLKPEKYVETDAPQIIKIAQELKGETALKTAKTIYSWVADSLNYTGFSGSEQGALWALKNKKGDCTEFMDLFTALARANEIPVRRVAGYVMPQSGILTPTAFHNWAEFYAEGRWQVADPQKKKFITDQNDYIAIRIIGPTEDNPMADFNRFRLIGDGLTAKMNN